MADITYGKGQQENLITILAHDDVNGKVVARLIEPELFEGELRTIAERCVTYWKKHGKAPGMHTSDLFADILDDPKSRKAGTYKRILRNMELLVEGVNTEYVLNTLKTTHRVQRMKDGILKSAERLNAQQELALPEVEEMLADLLRAREFEFDRGLTLDDVDHVIDYLETHYSEFRTGIEAFDQRDIVPSRGTVMLILAPTGFGKTWMLIHLGKQALLQRKKVLHISLEMSAEEVMQRYYQALFSISKRREEIEVMRLMLDRETGELDDVGHTRILKSKLVFAEANIRKKLKARLKPLRARRFTGRLVVKRFPPRSLTMNGLRAYLDALEATGFVPDMCVMDYIGITKTNIDNHRITLGRVMEDYRAVMVERNMAGVTAHQVSKVGAEARVVKATHVAEDWSLIGTSDIAVTYSQTPAENVVGLARLFVAKARSEADKFGVVITQAYKVGQFMLQSARLDKKYWDYLDDISSDDDGDERDHDDD